MTASNSTFSGNQTNLGGAIYTSHSADPGFATRMNVRDQLSATDAIGIARRDAPGTFHQEGTVRKGGDC